MQVARLILISMKLSAWNFVSSLDYKSTLHYLHMEYTHWLYSALQPHARAAYVN
jgi:hypothetical protein